ncbi:MAG: ribose transport system substrate-binding protein [Gaiellaceae bacterium]|nr:ribose transport system substrate-binding protein [Gaiellaceae bacterium]
MIGAGTGIGYGRSAISSLGPRGETAAPAERLELSSADAERARAARIKVGIVLHTADSDWSKQQVDGISGALDDYRGEIIDMIDSRFDPDRQTAALETLIRARPDAIISIPVDGTATADAHRKVQAAGIALVLMDNVPRGLQPGTDYATVVSADNRGNGSIAAEALAHHVPRGGALGIIGFGVDFFATDEREAAFRTWFRDRRPDVTVEGADFRDPSEAGRVATAFLASHPETDALFVVWDAPAMDAVRAARALGRDVAITTIDLGEEVAIELAAGGFVKGLGAQQPYDQGVAEALAAINASLGNQPPSWVAVRALAVTRDNVLEAFERVWHAPPSAALRRACAAATITVPADSGAH